MFITANEQFIENKLPDRGKSYVRFTRWFWTTAYVISLSLTIYFIVSLWEGFNLNPIVTSVATNAYPVESIPFPGIAVCNINKISKKRALQFHKDLSKYANKSEEQVLQYVKYIGQLHDFEFQSGSASDIFDFQLILEKMDLNIRELTRKLASPCDEVLRNCYWRGKSVKCTEIFELRLTYVGYCCTFNYFKRTVESGEENISEPLSTLDGVSHGLSFVVRNLIDDYWYASYSTVCYNVLVFVPTDFPDVYSGSLRQAFTTINTENFIEIAPTSIQATKDIANYDIEKRCCIFDSERPTNFEGIYSQSDCNVACKVRSVLALCQCIPFTVPIGDDSVVCTVTDLECLNKYRDKWLSVAPDEMIPDGSLQKEEQDSLRCNETCYPSCEGTFYEISINTVHLKESSLMTNDTSVHIFFGDRWITLYQMDVVFYWFEILSNFGGAFGITIGLSVGYVIEVVLIILTKIRNIYKLLSSAE